MSAALADSACSCPSRKACAMSATRASCSAICQHTSAHIDSSIQRVQTAHDDMNAGACSRPALSIRLTCTSRSSNSSCSACSLSALSAPCAACKTLSCCSVWDINPAKAFTCPAGRILMHQALTATSPGIAGLPAEHAGSSLPLLPAWYCN